MKLSIISPAYNEEEVLPFFFERVKKVCRDLLEKDEIQDYELVIIDDGSIDKTWHIIKEAHKNDNKIKGIKFSRNFGHHNTTIAGLDHAQGDFIIFMDSDLQAQPEDIPKLLREFKEGFDIVWGVAKERRDSFLVKSSSRLYYWIFNKIAGVKIFKENVMAGCSKLAAGHIIQLREVRQFAPAIWKYIGFKSSTIEIEKKERFKGTIKYTAMKRANLALVSIIGFSKFPLKISSILGFFMSIVGFSLGLFMISMKLFYGIPVPGYTSLFASIAFFIGIQLLILGIIGEYLGIIIDEVKRRPIYIVEEILGEKKQS